MIYSGEINYEKKYKEALEKARKTLEKSSAKDVAKLVVEYFFPELSECDDEKIRQWLVDYFKEVGKSWIHRDITCEQVLEWLEKQKEQKPELPLMGGDTDTYFDDLRITTKSLTSREWFNEGIKYAQRLQKEQHPSSKYLPGGWVVYDGPLGHAILQVKDVVGGRYSFVDNDSTLLVEDSDKFLRPLTPKDVEKKAEWSEEDDWKRKELIQYLEEKGDYRTVWMTWLKSLPERFNLEPKEEWSEEKKQTTKNTHPEEYPSSPAECISPREYGLFKQLQQECIETIEQELYSLGKEHEKDDDSRIKFLKSLRPSWKPSEEQLSMLLAVINDPNNAGAESCYMALKSIYNNLKKL